MAYISCTVLYDEYKFRYSIFGGDCKTEMSISKAEYVDVATAPGGIIIQRRMG